MSQVSLKCGANDRIMGTVQFHSQYASLLEKTYYDASKASNYCPIPGRGYSPRTVRSPLANKLPPEKRNLSNHAFGSAIDFNPAQNDYVLGHKGEVEDYPAFITTFENAGFEWLGDGGNGLNRQGGLHVGDDMHFQIALNIAPSSQEYEQDFEPESSVGRSAGGGVSDGGVSSGGGGGMHGSYYTTYDWFEPFRKDLKVVQESKVKLGKKFIIVNKSNNKDIEQNKQILFKMLKFYDDKLKFNLPVKIIFKDDKENSSKPLGKTGYYHPEETKIVVFTSGRLLKDILRSLGHELIHHKQHCIHPFENHGTPEGYAQKDQRLRRKEKEAYLYGNLLFRDFEDNYKTKHKGVF